MKVHARIDFPRLEELSELGQQTIQSILSTRGNLDGPFLPWLYSPEFASRAEKLGAFCRYETQLSAKESELIILIVATHFRCNAEWQIHVPIAQRAGLDPKGIELIRIGGTPSFSDLRLLRLLAFASELLSRNRISDQTFKDAQSEFSPKELIEIVGILGYYALVAMTLNSFEMRIEGTTNPFD